MHHGPVHQKIFVLFIVLAVPIVISSEEHENATATQWIDKAVQCGGVVQEATTIESPNFPQPYPPGSKCEWDIVVPSAEEKSIILTIGEIDLGPDCADDGDFIEIEVGTYSEKICGDADITYTISGNARHFGVLFQSNSDGLEGKGFSMEVSFSKNETGNQGDNVCKSGYVYLNKAQSCVDVDECTMGTMTCDPNATCRNEPPGSYTCECNPGYTGDGLTCTSDNPCPEGWITYPGASSCYFFSYSETGNVISHSWTQAQVFCQNNYNSNLVCLDSPEEQNFIGTNWQPGYEIPGYDVWIGSRSVDPDMPWMYQCVDGSVGVEPKPWYVFWLENDPYPDSEELGCATLYGNLQWGWKPCSDVIPIVCELDLGVHDACPDMWVQLVVGGDVKKCLRGFWEERGEAFLGAILSCMETDQRATLLNVESFNVNGILQLLSFYGKAPRWLDLRKAAGSSQWVSSRGKVLARDAYQNWIMPEKAHDPNYSDSDLCAVLAKTEWTSNPFCDDMMFPFICELAI